jgi:hypothetical protein
MVEIIMRNWGSVNFVCESIYDAQSGKYKSQCAVELHRYEVF